MDVGIVRNFLLSKLDPLLEELISELQLLLQTSSFEGPDPQSANHKCLRISHLVELAFSFRGLLTEVLLVQEEEEDDEDSGWEEEDRRNELRARTGELIDTLRRFRKYLIQTMDRYEPGSRLVSCVVNLVTELYSFDFRNLD